MPVTTLFGIPITDRASRLIAADCAEERALTELAALRDTTCPVVLESMAPPTVLPHVTFWAVNDAARVRHGVLRVARSDVLRSIMDRTGNEVLALRVCTTAADRFVPNAERRWHLDECQRGEGFITAPTFAYEYHVSPGSVLVSRINNQLRIHVHPDDAPRFGFGLVPAFPGE